MSELVEKLGGLEVGERVKVTLSDDTTFEGRANPIDYVPEESLRVEVRPEGGSGDRYEISAAYDEGWSVPQTRHVDAEAETTEWESLGTVDEADCESEWNFGT